MAVKNLEYYKQQVRKKFPNYSEAQVLAAAQSAYETDPESTFKKTKTKTTNTGKPTFDIGDEEGDVSGVLLGFGTGASLVPMKLEPYVISLLKKNPKAYASIKKSIETVTGRKYNDPNLVGAYVARLAENIYQSDDAAAKMVSLEDYLRLAAQYRTSAGAGAADVPTRQIYQKTEAERRDILNQSAQKLLNRDFNSDDMKQNWYKNLKIALDEMIDKGTLTTTKKVRNPNTGKIENVVESRPYYSEEKIAGVAEKAIQENLKEDTDRALRNRFGSWLIKEVASNG
jgi:hypothetical protein